MTLSAQPPTNYITVDKNANITSGGATLKLGIGVDGATHLWVSAAGDLRILSGDAPTSDTAGTVVGTQS